MSEQEEQAQTPPKRSRSRQGTGRAAQKQTMQPPAAAQPAPPPGEAAQAPTPNPPIGERWDEFPPPERQAELAQRLQTWDQEGDHGKRPGPFADFKLTGADVFWLAARVARKGVGLVIEGVFIAMLTQRFFNR